MRSSPYTKSWPVTSSRLRSPSSSAASGARFDRKRIQTEVSTRTITQPSAWLTRAVHGGVECLVRVAPIREEREDAHTPRGAPTPRARDGQYRYLFSLR